MPNFVHCINVKLCRLTLLYVQKEDVELRWILSSYRGNLKEARPTRWGQERQWGGQNRPFLVISVAIFSEPLELNDLEVAFYTKICFHHRFE